MMKHLHQRWMFYAILHTWLELKQKKKKRNQPSDSLQLPSIKVSTAGQSDRNFWTIYVFISPCTYVHVVPTTLSINTAEKTHHLRNMEGPTTDAFIRHKRINSKQMSTPTTECFCERSWNWHCSVKPNCLFNPMGVSQWVILFWRNYLWTSEH